MTATVRRFAQPTLRTRQRQSAAQSSAGPPRITCVGGRRPGFPAAWIWTATVASAAATTIAFATPAGARSSHPHKHAHAANVKVNDSASLHLTAHAGNDLTESGKATGSIPGTVRVSLKLNIHKATASFSISTPTGTLTGRGAGKLKFGKSGYDSFGGQLVVTGGTGRYAHASGKGAIYGSIYRLNDAMRVKVEGSLHL